MIKKNSTFAVGSRGDQDDRRDTNQLCFLILRRCSVSANYNTNN